ncbi:MAG: hypothetical protein ACLPKI_04590 [Streptosporangiaceae bacterium]
MLAQAAASLDGGNDIGTGSVMPRVIPGRAAVAGLALGALGISMDAFRLHVQLIKEVNGWVQQTPFGSLPAPPRPSKTPDPSLREVLQHARDHLGALSLPRDGQVAAAQVLTRLTADLNRVREQVTGLLPGYPGQAGPALARDAEAGRAEPGWAAELPGRVRSVESRLAAVESRVGTGPDVAELDQQIEQARRDREAAAGAQDYENAALLRDRQRSLLARKASRQDQWAAAHLDLPALAEELKNVRDEVEHLRGLLSQQDDQPQDSTT